MKYTVLMTSIVVPVWSLLLMGQGCVCVCVYWQIHRAPPKYIDYVDGTQAHGDTVCPPVALARKLQ